MIETQEKQPPRRWFRIVSPTGIIRLAIVVALCPIAGYFGGFHWTFDSFNHFQAQYFCLLLIATLTLALWRKPGHALITFAFLLLPAARLLPLYVPVGSTPAGPHLRVASFNVFGCCNTRYADAIEWIVGTDPDFIYLPEADETWGKGLAPLSDVYPHGIDAFVDGTFGFAFRSKYPVVRHEVHRLGKMRLPLLQAVIATPQGDVTVFGAHPVPPVADFWAAEWDGYLRSFAELAAKTDGHVVILGDLNTTRWSRGMAPFFAEGFQDSANGHGFSATWMRQNPLMAIPIDLILTRNFMGTQSRKTGPDLGSDHRPVTADLSW